MTMLRRGLEVARLYAAVSVNPLLGENPDSVEEALEKARAAMVARTEGQLTPGQIDLVANRVVRAWQKAVR